MSESAEQEPRQSAQPSPDPAQQPTTSFSSHKRHSTIDPLKAASISRPPVNIPPSTFVDSSTLATLRGTHQLSLGQGSLVHPRVAINTEQAPVTIGHRTVISSKCSIGNAASPSTSEDSPSEPQPRNIDIGDCVHIHPGVQIYSGTTIASYALLEPNVVLSAGCSVREHAKICANTSLPPGCVVPPWTVVWGDGGQFRRRRRIPDEAGHMGLEETSRIYALDREREAGTTLLRASAKQVMSSGSRSKR